MKRARMHADELDIDAALVHQLIAAQFPQWSEHPLVPVPSAGTDNALLRLGSTMLVRLPRIHWAVEQVEKEQQWLPRLAPHLPLAIPHPLAMGMPGKGYPWRWSVYDWLEGENTAPDRLADLGQAARDLADFVHALHQIDTTGGPLPGPHNSSRGVPLIERDAAVRTALAALDGVLDIGAAAAAWEVALTAPVWEGPPVWIHGDLHAGNLLAQDGKLSAVIDWGCLGIGDPACDLLPAWTLFGGRSRDIYREALRVDDATWERGRGWALSMGLIALPYYRDTNPQLAAMAKEMVGEALRES